MEKACIFFNFFKNTKTVYSFTLYSHISIKKLCFKNISVKKNYVHLISLSIKFLLDLVQIDLNTLTADLFSYPFYYSVISF